jgi:hypothetical protein
VSNYVQSTNFATKDTLSSGDPLKIVKGTEINTEFNNIATAVATKADLVSPTFTGNPVLPTGTIGVTQSAGNDTTAIATTAFVNAEIANDAPTKTGGGASGTWGIAITGNAATATSATSATSLTGSSTADINSSALASGTADNTTFLRGDRTWQTISTTPTTDQVLTATAGASAGAVGTYASAGRDISANTNLGGPGGTVAGSTIQYAHISNSADSVFLSGTTLPGTWRILGNLNNQATVTRTLITTFLRIS